VSGITTLDTRSFDEETTIVVVRSEDGWKIAAWRVMTFDEEYQCNAGADGHANGEDRPALQNDHNLIHLSPRDVRPQWVMDTRIKGEE